MAIYIITSLTALVLLITLVVFRFVCVIAFSLHPLFGQKFTIHQYALAHFVPSLIIKGCIWYSIIMRYRILS